MSEITWQKLNDPKILAEVEKRFELHILLYNDIKEALKFARWLEPIIEDTPGFAMEAPEMAEKYHNFVLRCKFIALELLSPEEIEDLFERHIAVIFQLPEYYDLWERLRVKLVAIPLYEKRDEFKKKLLEALLRNQQFLTPDIIIKEDEKEKAPTVENWLRSYITAVGIEPAETIKRSEYLIKNKNIQKLLPNDRKKMEQLIALFEKLKLSSLTPIGLEEHVQTTIDGKLMVFREGRLEEIGSKAWDVIKQLRQAGFFPEVKEESKEVAKVTTPSPSQNLKAIKQLSDEAIVEGKSELKFLPKKSVALIPPPEVMHEGHPLKVELEELVEDVMQNVESKTQNLEFLKDSLLRKRFRAIVSARLREVRDALETKAMLERPVKIGGMGFQEMPKAQGQMPNICEIIEKAFREFEKKWKAIEEQRVEEWKRKQKAEREKKEKQAAEKESAEMEKRYKRLTDRGQATTDSGLAARVVEPKIEKKIPPPPVPPVQKTKVIQSIPSPIPAVRSAFPVPRSTPKVTDVRRVPRLTGPVDEIASLTLSDFKRLAPTAKDAAAKIIAKIEFLSQESLARRNQAISAWQRSPLNQFYVSITRQALISRISPQTLLAELGQQGKPTLTTEEFYAIMDMNQKLRF